MWELLSKVAALRRCDDMTPLDFILRQYVKDYVYVQSFSFCVLLILETVQCIFCCVSSETFV